MDKRASGILLHISSLPSPYGIGDLGAGAYSFADFLASAKQSYWQILPINPIDPVYGNSPYSTNASFAGNPLFISPDRLVEEGFIKAEDVPEFKSKSKSACDYKKVITHKNRVLNTAYEKFCKTGHEWQVFKNFCAENSAWLDDYAMFVVLKRHFNHNMWSSWPEEFRDRHESALTAFTQREDKALNREKFLQYLFFKQWRALKAYCNEKGIQIIGDLPIYVSYDSADVWSSPEMFKLDENGKPVFVAGVPPDYFSKTGQLWGNPVYEWKRHRDTGYAWWLERFSHNLAICDIIRIDHFRGFVSFWEVPASHTTAIEGHWCGVAADDFFEALQKSFPDMPIIAEDLGIITDEVRRVMEKFRFPGMKVLLFAFGEDNPYNPYLPHNYINRCVVYTGTHDNNTARGWFISEIDDESKQRLCRYLGFDVMPDNVNIDMMRLAMMSVADTAIIQMQDMLGLDQKARMNTPSIAQGNWQWRLKPEQITDRVIEKLREMTEIYRR